MNILDDEMGVSTYNYGILKYDSIEKVGVVKTDCRSQELISFKLYVRPAIQVVTSEQEAHYNKDDELVTTSRCI